MIVEKKVFSLPEYRTVGGAALRDIRVGWESYGTLDADRSNAILITHYFSGMSHAAGRYAPSDPLPGYWDTLVGPGKPIDTERWFVLSSDTLINLNANDPNVVTTGPASTDPATGRPYGMTFPIVTIADFVRVQQALVASLGITRLRAVAGPSMGALQAFEWAMNFPEMVERIVPVIGAAGGDPFLMAWLDVWGLPVRLDPNWKGGSYYGGEPPRAGLAAALKIITLHAQQTEWARETFGRAPAVEGRDPSASIGNRWKIEAALDAFAADRARLADANHLLYLVRANQLAATDPARIRTPTLLVNAPTDLLFPPAWIERTAASIRANGVPVERAEIHGPNGHLNGLLHVAQAGPAITAFLDRPLPG